MGPRAGLDAVVKRKNPRPCRQLNPGRPTRSSVTILTELLVPLTLFCFLLYLFIYLFFW